MVGCLGLAPFVKKAALSAGAEPLPLAVASGLTAAALAAAFWRLGHPGGTDGQTGSGTWRHLAVVGVLGSGAVVLLSIIAMTGTTATNRSLFQSMYPVATAIAARALLGERLSLPAYGLIAIMTLGLFLMNTDESRLVFGRSFWLLAATLPLIGLSDVYAKRTLRDAEPSFVAAGRLVFGACLLLTAVPWIPIDDWPTLSGLLPWVIASGLLMAGGALGLYRAMDTVGASLAAAFAGLAPLVTVTAEWLFLETRFGTLQLSGLALVAAGGAALARRI